MDELSIVNSMLTVIGEHPVSTLSSLHPSVTVAKSVLELENYQVQSRGWFFNTEYGVTLKPAADGRVVVPSNTLKVKSEGNKYVQRGSVLYNMTEHTDKFAADVSVDLTVQVDITDLPPNAQAYLCACARYAMFLNEDGEGNKMVRLENEKNIAYARLNAEHIVFVGQNLKSSQAATNVMKGAS